MRRRDLLVSGGTIAAAGMAGCIGSAANPNADGESDSQARTISVSGSGELLAEPDVARFSAAIEERGDDPATVRDALSTRISTLRDALLDAGLEEDAIRTGHISIRSTRHHEPVDGSGDDRPPAYYGTHDLTVEVGDVDAVGEIIDVAVDAGADRVSGVRFTLSDAARAKLREDALSEAIAAATDEAEHIAAEVDSDVIAVKHVDSTGGRVVAHRAEVDVADDSAGTEVYPDDVRVTATVTVVYEIE